MDHDMTNHDVMSASEMLEDDQADELQLDAQDEGRWAAEACGENDCICYCTGTGHPCGCVCPRDGDGQLIRD